MCDSDDPGESSPGMDLTGFLFGNIDERGQLEDDGLLDGESKRMLSALTRLGLGSMLSEVLDEEEVSKEDQEKDYTQKSPSAIDYFDIDDAAEDIKEDIINQLKTLLNLNQSHNNGVQEVLVQQQSIQRSSDDSDEDESTSSDEERKINIKKPKLSPMS